VAGTARCITPLKAAAGGGAGIIRRARKRRSMSMTVRQRDAVAR
jgi:hypothetical protein